MKNKPFYIFEISILDQEENAVRKILIEADKTLYKFAEAIVKAFGFRFDHAFGFYSSLENGGRGSKAGFELFADMDDGPREPHYKGVQKVKIREAFKAAGDKMLFCFDYGDDWRFSVELKEIKEDENQGMKTEVIESIGKAPVQYPPEEE